MKLFIFTLTSAVLLNFNTAFAAVAPLPSDNLLKNPWFRDSADKPSLEYWVDATGPLGGWGASDKPGNPSPNDAVGTAARLSVGEDGLAVTIPINYPAYLYQVVASDPAKKTLKFDMFWVAHTVKPAQVTVYGGASASGPWTQVWQPFNKTYTQTIIPPAGTGPANAYLWNYYSALTSVVSTTIPVGYPYYKVEVHAILPDEEGGFKITGMYFANGSEPTDPVDPGPIDTDPRPDPVDPGDTDPRPRKDRATHKENRRSVADEIVNAVHKLVKAVNRPN